jgi:guanylate kinase
MSNNSTIIERSQILFSLCGPGGAGKSTLCRKLIETVPGLQLSISTTTRKPRPGEVDGVHYRFVSNDEFEEMFGKGLFLEYARFNGNYYGTENAELHRARSSSCDLLLDIDYQGAKLVGAALGKVAVTIFVTPPSIAILENRLRSRDTDSEETIQQRLKIAKHEIDELLSPTLTDYVVVNDTIDGAISTLSAIISAERVAMDRVDSTLLRRTLLA